MGTFFAAAPLAGMQNQVNAAGNITLTGTETHGLSYSVTSCNTLGTDCTTNSCSGSGTYAVKDKGVVFVNSSVSSLSLMFGGWVNETSYPTIPLTGGVGCDAIGGGDAVASIFTDPSGNYYRSYPVVFSAGYSYSQGLSGSDALVDGNIPSTWNVLLNIQSVGTGISTATASATSTASTTTESTTTSTVSESSTSESCSKGYHLGGIPGSGSSLICVPDGLQVDQGSVSTVVDLSTGGTLSSPGPGSLVQTSQSGVVDVTCAVASACPTGPATELLGGSTQAALFSYTCDATSCDLQPSALGYWSAFLDKAYQLNPELKAATDILGYYDNVKTFAQVSAERGFLQGSIAGLAGLATGLIEGWAYDRAQGELNRALVFTQQMGVAGGPGPDPSFTVYAAPNGTMVRDLQGTVYAESFVTGQMVTLSTGQDVFVSNNETQASQQTLSSSVRSFNTGSLQQWWQPTSTAPLLTYGLGAAAAGVVVVGSLFFMRRRRHGLPPPPPEL